MLHISCRNASFVLLFYIAVEAVGWDHSSQAQDYQLAMIKGDGPSARDTLVHNTNANVYALRHGDWVLIAAKTGAVSKAPEWFDEANGYTKNDHAGVRRKLSIFSQSILLEFRFTTAWLEKTAICTGFARLI